MSLRCWASFLGAVLVANYSTWEDPLLSQKKHLWNISSKTGNCIKGKTLTLSGLYISWRVEKNESLNYNTTVQLNLYCPKIGKYKEFPMFKPSWSFTKTPSLCGSCNWKHRGIRKHFWHFRWSSFNCPNFQGGSKSPLLFQGYLLPLEAPISSDSPPYVPL